MRPGHVRREGYTSDLDLVAWLDQLDTGYDVVTDEDLHRAGRGLLQRYQVALTGTHPEYMSARMFDAIADWTAAGGRLMYLGGNGFSMNVNFDAERPWIMENRRVELWERDEEFQRSEAFNSTDGRRGGYFTASGRQPADGHRRRVRDHGLRSLVSVRAERGRPAPGGRVRVRGLTGAHHRRLRRHRRRRGRPGVGQRRRPPVRA